MMVLNFSKNVSNVCLDESLQVSLYNTVHSHTSKRDMQNFSSQKSSLESEEEEVNDTETPNVSPRKVCPHEKQSDKEFLKINAEKEEIKNQRDVKKETKKENQKEIKKDNQKEINKDNQKSKPGKFKGNQEDKSTEVRPLSQSEEICPSPQASSPIQIIDKAHISQMFEHKLQQISPVLGLSIDDTILLLSLFK